MAVAAGVDDGCPSVGAGLPSASVGDGLVGCSSVRPGACVPVGLPAGVGAFDTPGARVGGGVDPQPAAKTVSDTSRQRRVDTDRLMTQNLIRAGIGDGARIEAGPVPGRADRVIDGRPSTTTVPSVTADIASDMGTSRGRRRRRVLLELLVLSLGVVALQGVSMRPAAAGSTQRLSQRYDPPVLAGQMASIWCGGGVYARHGNEIVLTSSGHCASEGDPQYNSDGSLAGIWGPISQSPTCAHPDNRCMASDMNYLVVAPDQIPWGHLDQIDLGAGGYRSVQQGLTPLECPAIAVGDEVEFDGRALYRTGHVLGQREYLPPAAFDATYFPCIVLADISVDTGDSGGVVFVRGIPSGIAARSFGDTLGFTPLGSGLAELGLSMCDTPNCGLTAPKASAR